MTASELSYWIARALTLQREIAHIERKSIHADRGTLVVTGRADGDRWAIHILRADAE